MKTNLDTFFKTNETYEKDGVDCCFNEDISFRIRRFSLSNPRAKAAATQHLKPYARQMEIGSLDSKKADEINIKMFVDACLVSWTGVEEDGKPLEFSREAAIELFTGLPDLFEFVWKFANSHNNFKDDVGNS